MKNIFLLTALLSISTLVYSQYDRTYIVDTKYMSTHQSCPYTSGIQTTNGINFTGPIDLILDHSANNNALVHAENGESILIKFEVPGTPGQADDASLIIIDNAMPTITPTPNFQGNIYIEKGTTSYTQGFIVTVGAPIIYTQSHNWYISSLTTKINSSIYEWTHIFNSLGQNTIVKLDNCIFEDLNHESNGIYLMGMQGEINGSVFNNYKTALLGSGSGFSIKFTGNTITNSGNTSSLSSANKPATVFWNGTILEFSDNTFSSNHKCDVALNNGLQPSSNPFRLIEPNSLGYTPVNSGNTWSETCVNIDNHFHQKITIVGETFSYDGRLGKNSEIRATKFISGVQNSSPAKYGSYYNLLEPTEGNYVLANDLITFKLKNDLQYVNGLTYKVDIYRDNDDDSYPDQYMYSENVLCSNNTLDFNHTNTTNTIGPWDKIYATVTKPGSFEVTSDMAFLAPQGDFVTSYCGEQFFTLPEQYLPMFDMTDSEFRLNGLLQTYPFELPYGMHTVTVAADIAAWPWNNHTYTINLEVLTEEFCVPCDGCIGSFAPIPSEEYTVTAWVKEDNALGDITYLNSQLQVEFLSDNYGTVDPPVNFSPAGKIIDGWQRIEGRFTVHGDTKHIRLNLLNTGSNNAYFDDIKVQPTDASMVSYVYDPVTGKLAAQLDENNYATFYEYDEEGKLIRVKKETERGIQTIQESREHLKK